MILPKHDCHDAFAGDLMPFAINHFINQTKSYEV